MNLEDRIERLNVWNDVEGKSLEDKEGISLMTNFIVSCDNPQPYDLLNFHSDIRYFSDKDKEILHKGFYYIYDLPDDYFDPELCDEMIIYKNSEPSDN